MLIILLGIIKWPQALLIAGLILLFIFVMRIPKTIKEINSGKDDFKDASADAGKPKNENNQQSWEN